MTIRLTVKKLIEILSNYEDNTTIIINKFMRKRDSCGRYLHSKYSHEINIIEGFYRNIPSEGYNDENIGIFQKAGNGDKNIDAILIGEIENE